MQTSKKKKTTNLNTACKIHHYSPLNIDCNKTETIEEEDEESHFLSVLLLRCTANGSWSCCRRFSAGCRWQRWSTRRCWYSTEGSPTPQTSVSSPEWTDTLWGLFHGYWIRHRCTYVHFHFMSMKSVLSSDFFSPPQYVSALRPPKKRHQSSAGMSIDSDVDEDIWSTNKLSQRRTSLTYPNPLRTRNNFQNRSLQDFSDRIKAVDELESHKRKQSIYDLGLKRSEKEVTSSASSDSMNSDNAKDEWKQVMNEFWTRGFAQILI